MECFKPGIKAWAVMDDESAESMKPMEEVHENTKKRPGGYSEPICLVFN